MRQSRKVIGDQRSGVSKRLIFWLMTKKTTITHWTFGTMKHVIKTPLISDLWSPIPDTNICAKTQLLWIKTLITWIGNKVGAISSLPFKISAFRWGDSRKPKGIYELWFNIVDLMNRFITRVKYPILERAWVAFIRYAHFFCLLPPAMISWPGELWQRWDSGQRSWYGKPGKRIWLRNFRSRSGIWRFVIFLLE